MVAATAVGGAAVAAGWLWAVLLAVFFATSTALTAAGAARKRIHTHAVAHKHDRARDARQVLANGGVFAAAAATLATLGSPSANTLVAAAALGALAAATADTWATELGLLSRASPRSIVSGRAVAPGMSGGVTALGSAAGVAGAAVLACVAAAGGAGWTVATAGLGGGVAGMLADSVLGATVQVRYHCGRCNAHTEQPTHVCGARAVHDGGLRWADNDIVNLAATVAGAGTAVAIAAAWSAIAAGSRA